MSDVSLARLIAIFWPRPAAVARGPADVRGDDAKAQAEKKAHGTGQREGEAGSQEPGEGSDRRARRSQRRRSRRGPKPAAAAAAKPVSFMRDVAPILVENCIACHNPRKSESKYVMTTFAQLAKGGQQGEGITLEPGEPDESRLVELIRLDGQPRMPFKQDPLPPGKDRAHRALGHRRGQVRRRLARRGLDDPAAQDAAGHDSRGLSGDRARSRRSSSAATARRSRRRAIMRSHSGRRPTARSTAG